MSTLSASMHSIIFKRTINGLEETKNTYDDWSLIPSSKPMIAMPTVKTAYAEVLGADGLVDLSEVLTLYGNRTGSIEFYMDGYSTKDNWAETISAMAQWLHGKKVKLILEDDSTYYYEGRVSINELKSQEVFNVITFEYSLAPYKRLISNPNTKSL